MNALKNINWKRIGTMALGAIGVYTSSGGTLPPWVAGVAGLIAGTAVNAEKVMAKRKRPASPFDSVDAASKVERMR
jgi:hypothetical protein